MNGEDVGRSESDGITADALMREVPELVGHHRHRPRRLRKVVHRNGVPYEIERVICSRCGAVILERTLRRADG